MANYFVKTNAQMTTERITPNIENYTTGVMAIDEINSNVAVQGKPIAMMGNISFEQKGQVVGMRVEPISRQKKLNRR